MNGKQHWNPLRKRGTNEVEDEAGLGLVQVNDGASAFPPERVQGLSAESVEPAHAAPCGQEGDVPRGPLRYRAPKPFVVNATPGDDHVTLPRNMPGAVHHKLVERHAGGSDIVDDGKNHPGRRLGPRTGFGRANQLSLHEVPPGTH